MKNISIIILLTAVLIGLPVILTFSHRTAPTAGYGAAVRTVTSATTSIATSDTVVNAAGTNLQRLILRNPGPGQVWCAFGTTSTVATGLAIDVPNTTSTAQERDITDSNLLAKSLHCIATATSVLSVLQY